MKFLSGVAVFLMGAGLGYVYGHTHGIVFLFMSFLTMLLGGHLVSASEE